MKKLLYISFVALSVFSSCNQSAPSSEPVQLAVTPADQELLEKAQDLFKPVASRLDNPENPITKEKVALGKVLYYDTRLSKTGNNSCNSCHNLSTYGVDNLPTSKGDNGGFGGRNSPTVLNAAYHTTQFWDGRAVDVEEQAGGPILNPVEMAIPSKEFLIGRLKDIKEYQDMFKAAYPEQNNPIVYENVQKAIGAFERTLITPSPFDKYLRGDVHALNSDARVGLKTFIDVGCASCHSGVAIGGNSFQKFGVHGDYRTFVNAKSADFGRKDLTKKEEDKDQFKVPSLRNITMTHPYFHDGCVSDLAEVVRIMGKSQLDRDLSEAQVKAIVAFLHSLTGEVPADAKVMPEILVQN